MTPEPTNMEAAAIALVEHKAYAMGREHDHFAFAGGHEDGCLALVRGGLASERELRFASTCDTMTTKGHVEVRKAYRLTHEGKLYADHVSRAFKPRIKPCESKPESTQIQDQ